ncbi:hypothetical protein HON01_09295 [Candidatus Woesearchaeota archaeon]|jgi:uncharacterized membrane protein|nr:hypothetical protein [Candidatus Woesearchaeota archaeon]MBT7367879.1 hypothetical protein [Candidatus Woesearchaeota archaeon]
MIIAGLIAGILFLLISILAILENKYPNLAYKLGHAREQETIDSAKSRIKKNKIIAIGLGILGIILIIISSYF